MSQPAYSERTTTKCSRHRSVRTQHQVRAFMGACTQRLGAPPAACSSPPHPPRPTTTAARRFAREFPYSVDTLFDNTLDPAHVPWSHHGIIGNREMANELDLKVRVAGPQGGGNRGMASGRANELDLKVRAAATVGWQTNETLRCGWCARRRPWLPVLHPSHRPCCCTCANCTHARR